MVKNMYVSLIECFANYVSLNIIKILLLLISIYVFIIEKNIILYYYIYSLTIIDWFTQYLSTSFIELLIFY